MSPESYFDSQVETVELRHLQRLQRDLGVNQAAAESILHLRRQVLDLQSRLRQLEHELTAQSVSQELRLVRYREVSTEAFWIELEFQA